MFYTVYKITNIINDKIYIGKHQTKDLNDGYMGSGKHLRRAIVKYGIENFKKEMLFQFDSEAAMNAKEAELVTEEFCLREDTYNLCPGGKGGWGYNNTIDGQKLREHSYKNWSSAGTSSFVENFNTNEELRIRHLKHLETIRLIGREKIKEIHPNGTFYGKIHTSETRAKIGLANSAKQIGNKNSQFGTMWITNGKENKKIKKDLDVIPEGWYNGRVAKCG